MLWVGVATLVVALSRVLAEGLDPTVGLFNRQVKQVVYINSAILRKEVSIVAELDLKNGHSGPIYNYLVVVPPVDAPHLGHLSAAFDEGNPTKLPCTEVTSKLADSCQPIGARCFMVTFPRPLTSGNPKFSFGIGLSYVNRYQPAPQENLQHEPLGLKLHLSPYFYSPYPTERQKTVLMLVREFEMLSINCPKPHNLTPTYSPSAVGAIPGSAQFTCGVYERIPAYNEDNGALAVYFRVTRIPFFTITRLERTLRLEPVWRRVQVEDEYEIKHTGFNPKDHAFSKFEYLQALMAQRSVGQMVPIMPVLVPAAAQDLIVRDELGLLTNPIQRRPYTTTSDDVHLVEISPRNALFGGWSLAYKMSYTLPLDQVLQRTSLEEGGAKKAYRLVYSLVDVFHDVVVENFGLKVILPATIRVHHPSSPIAIPSKEYIIGMEKGEEPTVLHLGKNSIYRISMKNVVKEHYGTFEMLFEMSWWAIYRQFILLAAVAILAGIAAAEFSTIDLAIDRAESEITAICAKLAALFQHRRELVAFEIPKQQMNNNSKEGDKKLEEQIQGIESSIFQLLGTLPTTDRTIQAAASALRRLYEEQLAKMRQLKQELSQNGHTNKLLRLEKDRADLDERVLQTEARLLTV